MKLLRWLESRVSSTIKFAVGSITKKSKQNNGVVPMELPKNTPPRINPDCFSCPYCPGDCSLCMNCACLGCVDVVGKSKYDNIKNSKKVADNDQNDSEQDIVGESKK